MTAEKLWTDKLNNYTSEINFLGKKHNFHGTD
jgi:hypothetical protein